MYDIQYIDTDTNAVCLPAQPNLVSRNHPTERQVPVALDDANDMKPDERSAHAGLPVTGGHKWIATKWIHPLPYPHGNEGPETPQKAA